MKVLQVNSVYRVGSTGKIVAELHAGLLDSGIESVVCYGRGKRVHEKNVYKTCGELYAKANHLLARMRGMLYGGCSVSTGKLISIIKREQPDIVHLQCINGFFVNIYHLVAWLKGANIKTVLTLHAEFMFTANCGHARDCGRWKQGCGKCPQLKTDLRSFGIDGTSRSWNKMRAAFDSFGDNLFVVSVSPWLSERAAQSPFFGGARHCVVMNGLDASIFYRRDASSLRERYGEKVKLVLFVTNFLTDREEDLKGGRYIIELAKQLERENVVFLVTGRYDQRLELPANMTMLGYVNSQDMLAEYYSAADATVLVSLRETFSMVTAESLCCGTPVVGFEAGGPETIALPEYSRFVEQGNVGELKCALLEMLACRIDREELGEKARRLYSGKRMVREYIEVYRRLLGYGQDKRYSSRVECP